MTSVYCVEAVAIDGDSSHLSNASADAVAGCGGVADGLERVGGNYSVNISTTLAIALGEAMVSTLTGPVDSAGISSERGDGSRASDVYSSAQCDLRSSFDRFSGATSTLASRLRATHASS